MHLNSSCRASPRIERACPISHWAILNPISTTTRTVSISGQPHTTSTNPPLHPRSSIHARSRGIVRDQFNRFLIVLRLICAMSDEEGKADLLEQLKELDRRDGEDEELSGLRGKFKFYCTKFKIKEALGHLGLLIFLCVYCIIGGLVSDANRLI